MADMYTEEQRHHYYSLPTAVLVLFRHSFFSSRRRHTRCSRDWSSDVCSSDLQISRIWACYTLISEDRGKADMSMGRYTQSMQARSEERRVGKEGRSRGSP